MIGTTHLLRQRNDEPFLDLHLFRCTCITVINVKKRISNCTVNICNMYICQEFRKCKKSLYNQPNHIFSKNYYEVISGKILTNVTPKHSELSIFWLFIYSLCCYEWFLFVHNLNTTNKKLTLIFLYISTKNKS
jgi:hypothetical protein